jgi:hypothetical protein
MTIAQPTVSNLNEAESTSYNSPNIPKQSVAFMNSQRHREQESHENIQALEKPAMLYLLQLLHKFDRT